MSIIVSARIDAEQAGRADGLRLQTERLSDRLAAKIAERIDSGALQPGDRLPTELQFAAAYGVSRTVVREAVQSFFERFPAAQPAGDVTWIRNLGLRGMATFPVRLGGG